MHAIRFLGAAVLAIAAADSGHAQTVLDRVDPGQTDRQQRAEEAVRPDAPRKPSIEVDAPTNPLPAAGPAPVMVGAIAITGLQVLAPDAFAAVVADTVGRPLDREQLTDLVDRIVATARARGFVFASATIAPQRIAAGVLTIRVDEGRIDSIRNTGDSRPAVDAILEKLVTGRPVTLAEVERAMLIAGDMAGVRIRNARYVREGDAGILVVAVDSDRIRGRAVLENDGSRPVGPEQLRIDVEAVSLLFSDDALAMTYLTAPFQPGELQYGRVRYARRVNSAGTEIGLVATLSSTEPGSYLAGRGIEGRSWYVGATTLHPLWRRRDASLWLEGEFGVRTLRQLRETMLARHDRVVAMRVGLYGNAAWAGGRLRVNATLSRGLDLFDATRRGDPLASRRDAEVDFTTLTTWADWVRPLGGSFSMRLATRTQLSSAPLLISEEIGLGGGAFLRGYNFNERSGDQGTMAMGELRYDLAKPLNAAVRRVQLYGFVDGGVLTNLRGGRGGGSLASGGGGLRTVILRGLTADAEIAVPFSGARYDTGTEAPRFNFRVVKTF